MKKQSLKPMTPLDRTFMTLSCRDSDTIPRVENAGRIIELNGEAVQVMHDGTLVVAGGYHGDWMAHVIRGLKGYHEPQEEVIFNTLLAFARHGTTMVELGAFWSYYSLWYLREVPGSRAVCVEPDPNSLVVGKRNVALNNLSERTTFVEGWVGGGDEPELTMQPETTNGPRTLPRINMDAALTLTNGGPIEMLHMDTQGAELPFLTSLRAEHCDLLRFLVISTHHHSISGSPTTHEDCLNRLKKLGAHILVEHNVEESYSGDGLVVASFAAEDVNLPLPLISRNTAQASLFRGL